MFMPGISLWRVLVQLAGMSLLVSYCVTLTLRAYHSTSCRATFNCTEETDPKLASLREWQVRLLRGLRVNELALDLELGSCSSPGACFGRVGLCDARPFSLPHMRSNQSWPAVVVRRLAVF